MGAGEVASAKQNGAKRQSEKVATMAKNVGFSGLESMDLGSDLDLDLDMDLGADLFGEEVRKRPKGENTGKGRISSDLWLVQNPMPEAAESGMRELAEIKRAHSLLVSLFGVLRSATYETIAHYAPHKPLIGYKTTSAQDTVSAHHPDVILGRVSGAASEMHDPNIDQKVADRGDVIRYVYLTAGCWQEGSGLRKSAEGKTYAADRPIATVNLPLYADKAVATWYRSKIGLRGANDKIRTEAELDAIFAYDAEAYAKLPDPIMVAVNMGYTLADVDTFKRLAAEKKVKAEDHPVFKAARARDLTVEISAAGLSKAIDAIALYELQRWIGAYNAPMLERAAVAQWLEMYARAEVDGARLTVPRERAIGGSQYHLGALLGDIAEVCEMHGIKAEAEAEAEAEVKAEVDAADLPDVEMD